MPLKGKGAPFLFAVISGYEFAISAARPTERRRRPEAVIGLASKSGKTYLIHARTPGAGRR